MRCFVQLVNPSVCIAMLLQRSKLILSHRFVFTAALRQGQNYNETPAIAQE
jgi:hypothetical protein